MKKIVAFAMSALLAASAVALPVAAKPVVPALHEVEWVGQPRPITAEELKQVRSKASDSQSDLSEEAVTVLPEPTVTDAVLTYEAAAVASQVQVPPPVLAHVTAGTIVFEPAEGYSYYIAGTTGFSQTSNVYHNLKPNTTYKCYLELPGNPSVRSEPLLVTTKDRGPCVRTPEAPLVQEYTSHSITLVTRPGYEYRMNDGKWQNTGRFNNLEPDTEYTFYQRIKETNVELASEESEPLHYKTAHQGPSSSTNMALLMQYIDDNGFDDEQGYKTLAYVITDEYGTEYYFLMTRKGGNVLFDVFSYSEAADVLLFNTEFPLSYSDTSVYIDFSAALYSDAQFVDYAEGIVDIYLDRYKIGDSLTIPNASAYLTAEDLSSLCTTTTEMLFSFWDEYIYNALGFGFRGLGFVATEGFGDLACNSGLKVHFGESVIKNGHETGCLVDGSEGDPYCTLCGQMINNPFDIPSRGYHVYDNDCDTDCNDCGEVRLIPHIYSYACDVKCDICGAVRTEPLAAHTFDANRLCTKCGHDGRLIGDISGDGKVNMGDVSRAYAHTTGKTPLTDPAALAAADTNGDGRINLGDTSRILSHVRGTKLLW